MVTDFSSRWKIFGTLLGLSNEKLSSIERDNDHQANKCCSAMLAEWCTYDPTACCEKVRKTMELLSRIAKLKPFIQRRSIEEVRPLNTTKFSKPTLPVKPGSTHQTSSTIKANNFTQIELILHEGNEITKNDAVSIANALYIDNSAIAIKCTAQQGTPFGSQCSSDYYSRCNKYTDIMDIFVELDHSETCKQILLILEGGPGMGKTTICKEAFYNLGKSSKYELTFLVSLHNPKFQNIKLFEEFFELYCQETSQKSLQAVKDYLDKTNGANVLVVVDGYDDLVSGQQSCSSPFVADIVYRRYYSLQSCDLMISSRQSQSAQLLQYHSTNCTRVEILGFTEDHKHQYVVQHCVESVENFKEYLHRTPSLHSASHTPFFLANLVSLFKASKLPKNETEVIDRLVCSMISWCLQIQPPSHNASITTWYEGLPSEYQQLIREVSKYAFTAYQNDTFIVDTNDNLQINGLGLLRTFNFAFTDANKILYAFTHPGIQEFLIAFYLTISPSSKQNSFRDQALWSRKYMNVWFHYCGLVKDDGNLIKITLTGKWLGRFLGGMNRSDVFRDKIKCLYLAYCFMQCPDDLLYKKAAATVKVQDNILDVSNCSLASEELIIIYLFLSRCSFTKWEKLDFLKCKFDDKKLSKALQNVAAFFNGKILVVNQINFEENSIKLQDDSFFTFMTKHNAKHCNLTHNHVTNDQIITAILSWTEKHERILDYKGIQNYNSEFLYCSCLPTHLNNFWTTIPLVELYLVRCNFNNEVVDDLCAALIQYSALSLLFFYDNKLICSNLFKIADSLHKLNKLGSFLLYEKSLSESSVNYILQTLLNIQTLLLVKSDKIVSFQATDFHNILALKYMNSATHLEFSKCQISHEVMTEVATLINSSPALCDVLDFSGSRVDDSHLDILINALHSDVTITSLYIPVSVSSLTVAELICSVHPSSVNISGSLTDGNELSVGLVVAENLFASQRQSTVMLTCADIEKVGIFHKLDNLSSCIEEKISQLISQLFINNCTIDGEVLADSLDNSKSVVLVHLSNIKWNGQVFYTSNSFVSNERITISVVENSLPDTVKESLLNTFDSYPNISRIISTDDDFIAHSCSYELVRWHLGQEASCDPLQLFYLCNCQVTTDPGWCKVVACFLKCKKVLSEVIMYGNNISTRGIYALFYHAPKNINKLYVSEKVLNCSWIVSWFSAVAHVTLLSSKMFISVRGVEKHLKRAVHTISQQLEILRLIHCHYTIQIFNTLVGTLKVCTNLQEFTVSGGNLMRLQTSACTIMFSALLGVTSLTHFSFNDNKIYFEAVDVLKTVIASNLKLIELRLNNVSLNSDILRRICPSIAGLGKLKVLGLTDNLVSERAAADLANAIAKSNEMEKLYLDNNYLGTEGITSIIIKLTKLNVLRFKNNKLGYKKANKLCKAISSNLCLENICFDNNQLCTTGMREVAQTLAGKAQLKVLDARNCAIGKEAANSVAGIITSSTKLMNLQISDNTLMAEGCNIIAVALRTITTLTKLYISNNRIAEQAADGITEVIISNSSLQVLDIGNNLLFTSGIIKIAKALSKLCSIKELWINKNYITEEASDEIAAAITSNTKLEKLQLDNNLLKATGVCTICKSLMKLSGLKVLLIGNNYCTQQSAGDIAAVVTNNPLIETLGLGNNRLETRGAITIATALSQVHHVKVLGLENNCITSEAASDMSTAIASNVSLEKLWLHNNKFDSDGIQVICDGVKCTNSLKVFQVDQIGTKGLNAVSTVISKHFNTLETLCISDCVISTSALVKYADKMKDLRQLKRLRLNVNHFVGDTVDDIAKLIASSIELERLWLYGNDLGDNGITKVMKNIDITITSLKVLHLANNNITESSAGDVAKVIANNPFLECVNLGYNRLKTTGVSKLVVAFKNLLCLKELSLNSNHIDQTAADDVASMIIGKSKLEKLYINNNRLKDFGLRKVCENLKKHSNLKLLQLANTDITPEAVDAVADVLYNNCLLEDLYLGGNNLQTEGVIKLSIALKQLHCLKRLSLDDNQITEEAAGGIAEVITSNSGLEMLWLYNNYLKDKGVNVITFALKKLHHLKLLQVDNNRITEKAADNVAIAIRSNCLFETIAVGNNPITNQGMIKLADALKGLHQIKSLVLNEIEIGKEVAKYIAEIINSNPELERLYLNNNRLEGIGIKELSDGIRHHSSFKLLQLSSNNIAEEAADGLSEVIANNSLLEIVALGGNRLGTRGVVKLAGGLKMLRHLEVLGLSDNGIEEYAAKHIAEVIYNNNGLEQLWLNNNQLKGVGAKDLFKPIKQHSAFTHLLLNNNGITDEAADDLATVLSKSKFLEVLSFEGNNFTPFGINKLMNTIRHLHTLSKLNMDNNQISEKCVDGIADVIVNNKGLKVLWLSNNDLKSEGISTIACALKELVRLTDLHLCSNKITEAAADDIAEAIANNPLLEHVDLAGNRLGSRGVVKLAGGLKMLRHLKMLGLDDNGIEEDAAKHIAEVIDNNTGLEKLCLNKNRLKGAGIRQLFEGIKQHKSFKLLQLESNSITEEAAESLALVIGNNKSLCDLYLGNNELKTNGICKIASVLKILHNVKTLGIDGNRITKAAAFAIAEVILNNSGLEKLWLCNNFLRGEGIKVIAAAIKQNATLKVLHLADNYITEEAADDIAEAIAHNPLLEYIDLRSNMLGSRGAHRLAGSLKMLQHLTKLSLDGDEDTVHCIQEVTNNNSKLEVYINNKRIVCGNSKADLKYNAIEQFKYGSASEMLSLLSSIRSFQMISIVDCSITEKVSDSLAELMQKSKLLSRLILMSPFFEKIEEVLSSVCARVLSTLCLENIVITDEVAEQVVRVIADSSAYFNRFTIQFCKLHTKGLTNILKFLQKITSLESFNLSCNNITESISEEVAAILSANVKLEEVHLDETNLETVGAIRVTGALKAFSYLTTLSIPDNHIKEEDATYLADAIANNKHLKEVYISDNTLRSNGISTIANALSTLTELKKINIANTCSTPTAADSITKVIMSNKNLEVLILGSDCRECQIADPEFLFIEECFFMQKDFSKLSCCLCTINKIVHMNSKLCKLLNFDEATSAKDLGPKYNKLRTEGIIKICEALRNTTLRTLSIENNDIDDEAADNIAAVIKGTTEMERLWVGSNLFAPTGLSKILQSLKSINTLKVLDISYSNLSFESECYLAEVLTINKGIKHLWLEGNHLSTNGLAAISSSLENCSAMKIINLRNCNINYIQEASIISFSKLNLAQLCIGNNKLCDEGIMKISSSINSCSLTTLDLSSTNITEVSVDSIVNVITSNSQLQQLFLGDNKLHSSGAIKIVTALQGSHTIQVLGLSHNHITSEAAGEISTAVSTMPYLSTLMLDGNELEVYGVCTIIEGVQHLNWLMILSLTDNVNNDQEEDVRRKFTGNKFKLYL